MTKLFDALVSHNTGRYVADIQPALLNVQANVREIDYSRSVVYEVSAKIGTTLIATNRNGLEDIKRRAWASINHHVYEEFRPDLAAMRDALYMRDTDKALTALHNLYDRMYKV